MNYNNSIHQHRVTVTNGDFKYDGFLSHNSKDKPEVEQLAVKLRAAGLNPFLDKCHLIPGQNWQPLLADAQRNSRTFAIFLSPNEMSPWHGEEAEYALSIQNAEKKKVKSLRVRKRHVIPILLPGNYSFDIDYLENRTYADFRAGLDDPVAFAYLLAGIHGRPPIDVLTERGLAPGSSPEANSKRSGAARPTPPGSRLPHPPNPAFTGRETELETIAAALLADEHANLLITQSVTGMGGLGKTQLAAEFCHRYGGQFAGVHWLNCQNPETVASEIAECGLAMGLALPDADLPAAVALTLGAWRERGPRLIVLDNLEREADLRAIRATLLPGGIPVPIVAPVPSRPPWALLPRGGAWPANPIRYSLEHLFYFVQTAAAGVNPLTTETPIASIMAG